MRNNVSNKFFLQENPNALPAVQKGDVAKAQEALKWGANVEAHDSHGNTPLLIATEAGDLEMVKLLLRYQADVSAADPEVSEHWENNFHLLETHFENYKMSPGQSIFWDVLTLAEIFSTTV